MDFYDLQIPYDCAFIDGASGNDWESVVCAANPGHQRAGRRLTPLFLEVFSGDVVDFSRTLVSDIVVTDHAVNVLQGARLTGFDVRPVNVREWATGVNRFDLPTLWEFVVTGRGGPAAKAAEIVEVERCDVCGLRRFSAYEHGLLVDESTYDGTDFLSVAEYPKHVLVNQRAKDVIEHARLTNVRFVESSRLEWPKGVLKPRVRIT